MFRKVVCYPHIDFYDLVEEVEKTGYLGDFETDFMEHHQPSPTCSIGIHIPSESDLKKYDWEEWELVMFSILRTNGYNPDETIYVDIDY